MHPVGHPLHLRVRSPYGRLNATRKSSVPACDSKGIGNLSCLPRAIVVSLYAMEKDGRDPGDVNELVLAMMTEEFDAAVEGLRTLIAMELERPEWSSARELESVDCNDLFHPHTDMEGLCVYAAMCALNRPIHVYNNSPFTGDGARYEDPTLVHSCSRDCASPCTLKGMLSTCEFQPEGVQARMLAKVDWEAEPIPIALFIEAADHADSHYVPLVSIGNTTGTAIVAKYGKSLKDAEKAYESKMLQETRRIYEKDSRGRNTSSQRRPSPKTPEEIKEGKVREQLDKYCDGGVQEEARRLKTLFKNREGTKLLHLICEEQAIGIEVDAPPAKKARRGSNKRQLKSKETLCNELAQKRARHIEGRS